MVEHLAELLPKDPTEAREQLRRFFHEGKIVMHPTEEGGWRTETRFYPAVILSPRAQKHTAPTRTRRPYTHLVARAGFSLLVGVWGPGAPAARSNPAHRPKPPGTWPVETKEENPSVSSETNGLGCAGRI